MAHSTVTGIVTRYVNYKDHDRILSIFTRERGRVDARARGCRRPKSPLLPCAQPFVYGEFQLYEGRGHAAVDQCDVRESFYPLREDVDRLAAAYAMLAAVQAVIQEDSPNEALFSSLYHSLSYLSYGQMHPLDSAIGFFTRFLADNGVCPTLTACACCGEDLRGYSRLAVSFRQGGALCPSCAAGQSAQEVSCLSLEAMRRILLLEEDGLGRVRLPESVRKELLPLLTAYVEYTLERPVQAFQALQDIKARD